MKIACLVACACLLVVSCSDDSNPTDTHEAIVASAYYPIESGATWTEVRSSGESSDTGTVAVSGSVEQVIGSESVQVYTLTSSVAGASTDFYFSDGGLYQVMLPYTDKYVQIPNGVEVGDTWTNELEDEVDHVLTCVAISETRTLTSTDGTSSTFENVLELRVQVDGGEPAKLYFAKGMGLVLSQASVDSSTSVVKTIAHNGQEIVWE